MLNASFIDGTSAGIYPHTSKFTSSGQKTQSIMFGMPTHYMHLEYTLTCIMLTSWRMVIPHVPMQCLKFLDEMHVDLDHIHSKKVLGPANEEQISLRPSVGGQAYSVMLLTSLQHDPPYGYDLIQREACTWQHFMHFILSCVERKLLVSGDILVLDNAKIHVADEASELFNDILAAFNIKYVHIPTLVLF